MHHRNRIRRRGSLRRKQIDHARARHRARRRVPVLQHYTPLSRRQHLKTTQRSVRIRHRSRKQTLKTSHKTRRARTLEQVRRVLQRADQPRRRAPRIPRLRKAQRQVELRRRRRNSLERRRHALELKAHSRVVLERQHHLEQRMTRQRTRRVQRLDKTLERNVLMDVRRKVARTHAPHKLAEARLTRRVGPQHQRVDEEPHQIVQRHVAAARNRRPDRDVRPRTQTRQQRA